jgi:acetoacetyl-CoA synthetase
VLFVKLAPGSSLTADLEQQLRLTIRLGVSPRHVPKRIVAVADIPVGHQAHPASPLSASL